MLALKIPELSTKNGFHIPDLSNPLKVGTRNLLTNPSLPEYPPTLTPTGHWFLCIVSPTSRAESPCVKPLFALKTPASSAACLYILLNKHSEMSWLTVGPFARKGRRI